MDIIKSNHPNDIKRCLEDTLSFWLKVCENPTWSTVVTALQNIGENNLARRIKKKYCKC